MEPGSDMVPISDHYCGWKKSIPKWVVYDIVLPTCVHINPCYPLVNVYITMEISTVFNGKINDVNGHFQ